jgi:hypothetical protein
LRLRAKEERGAKKTEAEKEGGAMDEERGLKSMGSANENE